MHLMAKADNSAVLASLFLSAFVTKQYSSQHYMVYMPALGNVATKLSGDFDVLVQQLQA